LKSYISEGRQIIRSIEEETLADNPPLFREYVTARPDIRLLMDNQFRNVKTHARLLSKAMWYEWRMKLLEGLKEGLDRHVEEMHADDSLLSEQEAILHSVVPELVERHALLDSEASRMQEIVDEMENIDPNELRMARERLAKVDAEIETKKRQLEEMQEDLQNKNDTIEAGAELKAEFLEQIREAERVREECRGWSIKEVNALKGKSNLFLYVLMASKINLY
jgi:kinetochore protein Spc7/SPC105